MLPPGSSPVLVACPDARPPAYQAVVGLSRAGLLHSFHTAYYYRGESPLGAVARRVAPERVGRWQRALRRRFDPEIPASLVRPSWSYDIALRLENRLKTRGSLQSRSIARWRTRRFDRVLARSVKRNPPGALLVFSDVGSDATIPACRALGIPTVLSMVHGDVREERLVLEREAEATPQYVRLYLGEGALDHDAQDWLHERRLQELATVDRVLVPSEHIAGELVRHGTPRSKIRVIPYAADTQRFRPDPRKTHDSACTFLFAGGISQRKGIRYLLEAWQSVRRPGWKLQLLGALPRELGPLREHLDSVEILGRVAHADVPAIMAAADVFVFPSLFEGSAVVTYEALACGLPSIVTPSAGSVVRDEIDGLIVPAGNAEQLASRMVRLGEDSGLRSMMAAQARQRAEQFDWPRYHESIQEVMCDLLGGSSHPL